MLDRIGTESDVQFEADWRLARAVCQGDPAAFGRVYGTYLPPVARFAAKHCTSSHAAAELSATVLTAVFEHLEGYSGRVALAAWVLAICRKVHALESEASGHEAQDVRFG